MADQPAFDISLIQATANKKKPEIKRLLMQNIRTVLGTFVNEKGIQKSADMLVFSESGEGAMPYDSTLSNWSKLGQFIPRAVEVQVGMMPVKEEIEALRDTYLVTLDDLNLKEKQLPFPEWFIETYTLVGLNSLHKVPYQGVRNAAGTNAIDICNGFFKIIEDEKAAGTPGISGPLGNLYTLSGAATDYSSSNIGDELKGQYFNFPDVTREKADLVEIRIPYRYREMYREWVKSEYSYLGPDEVNMDYLDGTDKKGKFIWESGMGSTSKKVIMNVTGALVYGTDRDNKEFGKPLVFHPNANPLWVALLNKIVIGFQIRTLDKRVFSVNNL